MGIKHLPVFISILLSFSVSGQQTVGLFLNDSSAFNGYTLLFPLSSTKTYLIDNCGNEVHQWTSSYRPGAVAYLLENGNLVRTATIPGSTFSGGGIGGRIEEYDWDGNLLWSYNYANTLVHQHHDIEVLPNGNILILAWEYKMAAEAIAQGRNPLTVTGSLWPDHIVEVEKAGTNQVNIVWEWHAWDHLIQDYDSTKANYGVIADHPELIDLNFTSGGGGAANSDWLHCNSVAYNADLDQILISNHNFGEIFIIDHSTSTAEASGHSGGNWGKGGDLLYRYGNPRAYGRGSPANQVFSGQHDAQWIPAGHVHEGKIMVFNNTGISNQLSAVDIFEPPVHSPGMYISPGNNAYGPSAMDWRYTALGFFSNNISGAQTQPNGNILICEGASGNIFEVTQAKQIVWDYINPVTLTGPVSQGANPGMNNVFRAYRYPPDYGAFAGRILTAGQPIELNPVPSNCQVYIDSANISTNLSGIMPQNLIPVKISNPFHDKLTIWNPTGYEGHLQIFSITGKKIIEHSITTENPTFNTTQLAPGVYIARLIMDSGRVVYNLKVVKP